jgi:hypothetical protein
VQETLSTEEEGRVTCMGTYLHDGVVAWDAELLSRPLEDPQWEV